MDQGKRYVIALTCNAGGIKPITGPIRRNSDIEAIAYARWLLSKVRTQGTVGAMYDRWAVVDMDDRSGLPVTIEVGFANV